MLDHVAAEDTAEPLSLRGQEVQRISNTRLETLRPTCRHRLRIGVDPKPFDTALPQELEEEAAATPNVQDGALAAAPADEAPVAAANVFGRASKKIGVPS